MKKTVKLILNRLLGNAGGERFWQAMRRVKKSPERFRIYMMKKRNPPDPTARRLNLGGGYWCHPGWENVDFYVDDWYIDHHNDLREKKPIDLPDGCA